MTQPTVSKHWKKPVGHNPTSTAYGSLCDTTQSAEPKSCLKHCLYNIDILPVLLFGADTWSMTVTAQRHLNAFDQWCLRHILRIPYTAQVSNLTVHKGTKQSPVTSIILDRHLKLFGHIRWADPSHDHACLSRPPSTIYLRTGNVKVVVLVSHSCKQLRKTSRPRTSATLQPGISHTDVPTGNVSWKQLYSWRSEPPDNANIPSSQTRWSHRGRGGMDTYRWTYDRLQET